MEPNQAIALIDQALSSIPTSRQDHIRLLQAVQVLKDALGLDAKPESDQSDK